MARVKAKRDDEINLSDIPELTSAQVASGTLRVAGKIVPRSKKRPTLGPDAAVIEKDS